MQYLLFLWKLLFKNVTILKTLLFARPVASVTSFLTDIRVIVVLNFLAIPCLDLDLDLGHRQATVG